MTTAPDHRFHASIPHGAQATVVSSALAHPGPVPTPAPLAAVPSHQAPHAAWGAVPVPVPLPLTSTGRRFGAYLLEGLLAVVTLGIGWLIWSMFTWGNGQTPAKKLLGMRVVRLDSGQTASWGQMAMREVVGKGLLGSLSFGITTLVSVFMILGASHQGVWDKVAGTVVVDAG